MENLCFSCTGCNGHKFTRVEFPDPVSGELAPIFNPRRQVWRDHFNWSSEYMQIIGLTATGRATVEALQLNRQALQNFRRLLFEFGEHPTFRL